MTIKPTSRPGEFTVHRAESEPHFALLLSPSRRGGKAWGISYRESPDNPPSPDKAQSHPKTREAAEWELRRALRVGNDYQLGLA